MVLENAKPSLKVAITNANTINIEQEVKFIYNELLTLDTISSVFDWLFREKVEFRTRYDEMRFVIVIYAKRD